MRSATLAKPKNRELRAALTLVEARLPADPFLLVRFERFYQEVVAFKAQLGGHSAGVRDSVRPGDVREHLLSLLKEQEEQVSHTGTLLGVEMYRQAQRVMACMADEIFSAVPWGQGTSWQSLEADLFELNNDQAKGLSPESACMRKLDLLLQQDDPAYRELAGVYFYALALSERQHDSRQQYLKPLREMMCGDGKADGPATGRVFAQSYAHTLAENRVAVLPSVKRWWLALGLLVLAWLGVSWLLWAQISIPAENKLQEIHKILRP